MAQTRQGDDLVAGWSPGTGDVAIPTGPPQAGDAARRGRTASDDPAAVDPVTGTPVFAAPGLVLLATVAIYEGYNWLRLIPDGATRPTTVVLAAVVVPATYRLTRSVSGPATGRIRHVARGCAVLVPALWVLLLLVHSVVVADLLGAVSLALALALVALAVLSEVGEHQRTSIY